jgi:menaquinone-dependent protoporphyrinogen IX oxidase
LKTLIVYDTRHGSSEEAAGRVAAAVKAKGGEARLLDLREKKAASSELSGYDAIALGAPFYMGSWSKRALAFASAREKELMGKRLGVFAIGQNAELGDAAAKAALPASLGSAIVASAYLGGRVDIAKLGGFERFVVKMVSGRVESSSTLDFGAVDAFAAALLGAGASR